MREQVLIGAVEGGGTKFVCALGTSPGALVEQAVITTTSSSATLDACVQFFRDATRRHGPMRALGIACFGPLQLRGDAPGYGQLLPTPKAGWSGVDVVGPFRQAFGIPIALDTDVGAAALGELHLGAGAGLASLAYVTVGTGIGGELAPASTRARLMHAEMGHLIVRRDPRDTTFAGVCPFHADCLEGLASGPAIRARHGCDLSALPAEHPGRAVIGGYLGQLAAAITLLHAPEALVIGGGVMADGSLLPLVRKSLHQWLAGYLPQLRDAAQVDAFIRAPALEGRSAITGAMLLALDKLERKESSP